MSASVRISRRWAAILLAVVERGRDHGNRVETQVVDELRRALEPRPRSSAVRKTEKKRRAKSKDTKSIRAAVMDRARGCCEQCGSSGRADNWLELDHQFGRVRARQSIRNTWMLCARCHRQKTNSEPSALRWMQAIANHAENHGYGLEAQAARARADALRMSRGEEARP